MSWDFLQYTGGQILSFNDDNMSTYTIYLLAIFLLIAIISNVSTFPDQGKWDYLMSQVFLIEIIMFINFDLFKFSFVEQTNISVYFLESYLNVHINHSYFYSLG